MPVIPGGNASQVLEPGSPVPLVSPESARAQGELISEFGKAVERVGLVIDKNRSRLLPEIAANNYQAELLKARAEQAGKDPFPDDASGVKAVESIFESKKKFKDTLLKNLENDDQRLSFQKLAGDIENSIRPVAQGEEVHKRALYNEKLFGLYASSKTAILRTDPLKYEETVNSIELNLKNSNEYTDSQKALMLMDAKKQALSEVVNGYMSDPSMNRESAIAAINQYGPGVYNNKEIKDMVNDVNTQYYHALQREDLARAHSARLMEQQKKDARELTLNYMYSTASALGNDEQKQSLFLQREVNKFLESGDITPQDYSNFINKGKVLNKTADDNFEFMVESKFMKAPSLANVQAAIKQVEDARGKAGGVSSDRAIDILSKLRYFEDNIKKDPAYAEQIRAAHVEIDAQLKSKIGDMKKFNEVDLERMRALAYAKLGTLMQKNPGANPHQLATWAVRSVFGVAATATIVPDVNPSDISDIQGVNKVISNIAERALREKAASKGNKLSPQREKYYKNILNKLNTRKSELGKDINATSGPSASDAGAVKSGR